MVKVVKGHIPTTGFDITNANIAPWRYHNSVAFSATAMRTAIHATTWVGNNY